MSLLQAAYRAGSRVERKLHPSLRKGRFIFPFTITDNATTAADLSALASARDRKILDVAGLSAAADNPNAVIIIERMAIILTPAAETQAILTSLAVELELTHTPAGGASPTRRLQAFEFITSAVKGVASGATAEITASIVDFMSVETQYIPGSPLLVNLGEDGLDLAPRAAVNSGANVTGVMVVDGQAFNGRNFVRDAPACHVEEDADVEVERQIRSLSYFGKRPLRIAPRK